MITCPHGIQHGLAALRGVVDREEPDLDKSMAFKCGCPGDNWTLERAIEAHVFEDGFVEDLRHNARMLRAWRSSLQEDIQCT